MLKHPLTSLAACLALGMILTGLFFQFSGKIYVEGLNYLDASTLVMIGLLILRGLLSLRNNTDSQAVSISLIGALSFTFCYEAIYKISFYLPPKVISPQELREFIIQLGIALTALAGFAFGAYRITRPSVICISAFVLAWIFWLIAGFPQIQDRQNYYIPVIQIHFDWETLYLLNRSTKVLAFLAYYFFYAKPSPVAGENKPADINFIDDRKKY